MEFKVFIPAAGTGSRLGELCRYVNKSLVSVGNKPAICHIIEKFPSHTVFVIALGYKGEILKEFLKLGYPVRRFEFVEVSPFEGIGSGLGLTTLSCRDHLRCPFIFCSCDTIVTELIPFPDKNWLGYSEVENPDGYRTLGMRQNVVTAIREKCAPDAECNAYIGLAGIKDYAAFWEAMSAGTDAIVFEQGESYGLRHLIDLDMAAHRFTWYDTGSLDPLTETRTAFQRANAPNILPKTNEDIWFVDGNVIKFSVDSKFIADRVTRSRLLKGFCPEIEGSTIHMYKYKEVDGEILSRAITLPLFQKLLEHSQKFWTVKSLADGEARDFEAICLDFYQAKTYQRVEQFYKNFDRKDSAALINGVAVPSTADLLGQIDWKWLSKGLPGNFHGDFHFENILYGKEADRFVFLDWRQDFGGSIDTGDIYYDFAKLNHGLIVCHDLINKNLFEVYESQGEVSFGLLRKQILVECEEYFAEFLQTNGYDAKKMRVLTALIFLNIAALHHYPYSLLLYYLGKSMLFQLLQN